MVEACELYATAGKHKPILTGQFACQMLSPCETFMDQPITNIAPKKVRISEVARKKRQIHLLSKMQTGAPLKASEVRELELFEKKDFKDQYPDWIVNTHEQVAKALNVSTRMVQYWAKDGMPVDDKGRYNLLDIQEWRSRGKNKKDAEESPEKTKWEVEFREMKAKLARIEYDKMMGKLLDKSEVEEQWVAIAQVFKQELVSFPNKVSPQLVGRDVQKIQAILNDRIDEILSNLNSLAGRENFTTGKQGNASKEKKEIQAA